MGNVIVAQMLPDGVVKGGSSLMFRYGGQGTRYTRDMDTARMMELDEYLRQLEVSLSDGWNGFTGKLIMVAPPKPRNVPGAYVMKLSYQIAQKLHAVSDPDSERAHDLVDLQLIVAHSKLDMADVRSKCHRLFDYRRMQAWPPKDSQGCWMGRAVYERQRHSSCASHC